jgi:two-component system, NarL family, nitrate/nitrite response regulator NarL
MQIRILISDPQLMFRDALRCILETEPDFQVVGAVANARETLQMIRELRPDILLLDISNPAFSGLETLRSLPENGVRTLGMLDGASSGDLVVMLKHGGRGILHKRTTPALLFKSVRAVCRGEYWIGHESIMVLVDALRSAPVSPMEVASPNSFRLTGREMEIVTSIVDGATNREIAQKLSISEQTVKHHLTNIFGKTGVSNRLELALFVMHDATGTFR